MVISIEELSCPNIDVKLLVGKTIKIDSHESEYTKVIFGKDIENNNVYILEVIKK